MSLDLIAVLHEPSRSPALTGVIDKLVFLLSLIDCNLESGYKVESKRSRMGGKRTIKLLYIVNPSIPIHKCCA